MGDAKASIPTVQPQAVYGRPMWGSSPLAAASNSVAFVSRVSITSGTVAKYGLSKRLEPVIGCRTVEKKDMKWNSATPKMRVDPESYEVWADGERVTVEAAETLPLKLLGRITCYES